MSEPPEIPPVFRYVPFFYPRATVSVFPGIVCAPAGNAPTIIVAFTMATIIANKKMRLIGATSYPPAAPSGLLLPQSISRIAVQVKLLVLKGHPDGGHEKRAGNPRPLVTIC